YLESENFFDYFNVLPESSGTLDQKLDEIKEYIKDFDWVKTGEGYLEQAEKGKASGNFRQYGYCLINAGELYAQKLTIDAYVYNIDSGDCSIPDDEKDWWAIAVDFHY
ncbi:MAG: hypothetical protein LBH43_16295, partial [Treponema sp.]|nr:hypothetical protein [Treponema sp.]